MRISSLGQNNVLTAQFLQQQSNIAEANRQLATGQRADRLSGLRDGTAVTSLKARNEISQIEQFQRSIKIAESRLSLMQTSLTRSKEIVDDMVGEGILAQQDDPDRLATYQASATSRLREVISLLNTTNESRFLFNGSEATERPVVSLDEILDGTPEPEAKQGLRAFIADQRLADDVDGLGRLNVELGSGNSVSLQDLGPDGFGFDIIGFRYSGMNELQVSTSSDQTDPSLISDITVSEFGRIEAGGTFTITLGLPDGSQTDIELVGTGNPDDQRPNAFLVTRGDSEATSNAFAVALQQTIGTAAEEDLGAVSAFRAADRFFDTQPPQVILEPGSPNPRLSDDIPSQAQAVQWYRGNDRDGARDGQQVRADTSITAEYGVRANDPGLRDTIKALAVIAAQEIDVSTARTSEVAAYANIVRTSATDLINAGDAIDDITGELGLVEQTLDETDRRHETFLLVANERLNEAEGINDLEVANRTVLFQTQLEASLQVTASLQRLSLVNVLSAI